MKYCSVCGNQLMDQAVICPRCGCAQASAKADSSNIGYAFLGFFVPIVGLILYLIWKDETPLRAKSAGKGALISVIVSTVLIVIYVIIWAVFAGSLVFSAYF